MKIVIAFFMLLFFPAAPAPAQISRPTLDLLTTMLDQFSKEHFDSVIKISDRAKLAVKNDVGANDPFYGNVLFIAGISHHRLFHYKEAEQHYLEHKALLARTSGTQDKAYGACLSRIATLYREMGRYQESIALLLEQKKIADKLEETDREDYSKCINNLALLYSDIGNYAQAAKLYDEALGILRNVKGVYSESYASCLNNIGTLYTVTGKYDKADSALQQVIAIRKKIVGEKHNDYAEALNNLAALNVTRGRYDAAEQPYLQALDIFKAVNGITSPVYAIGLNNLAQLYQTIGKYEKAQQLYETTIALRKQLLGVQHPDYATSLSNLAGLFVVAGRLDEAESLYVEAKSIKLAAMGPKHPEYASALNNIGGLYESQGQYRKAEAAYLEALEIKRNVFGEDHPDYALGLNNLGYLYYGIGQYDKTEPLFVKALEIFERSMGRSNVDYAHALNNLGNVWQSQEKFDRAEKAFKEVLDIERQLFGTDNDDYALALNNLATLYADQHQLAKAEPLLIEAKETWKRTVGTNSPSYAVALNNLAGFYRRSGTNFPKAEALYLEALRIRKASLGEHHPRYADTQNDLALLYMQMGEYPKAASLFASSSNTMMQNVTGIFNMLSEKGKGQYLAYNRELTECNNSFLYNYPKAPASVITHNYDLELGLKSLSLADTRSLMKILRNSSDTTLKRVFSDWMTTRTMLAREYSLPAAQRKSGIQAMETQAENLEKELNRRSTQFREQQRALHITSNEVKNALQPDEAAVEFIRFRLYNQGWSDTVMYAAYILRKDVEAPVFVPLCDKKALQLLFDSAGTSTQKLVKSFYRGLDIKAREAKLGQQLYQLIWAPLEPYLKGIRKIAYAPAGKLYSVAFHALPVDSNSLLMDRYELQQYTSTRQVALRGNNSVKQQNATIALFGAPQFSMDSLQLVQQRNRKRQAGTIAKRGASNGAWVDLPGTGEEIARIAQLFKTKQAGIQMFRDENASEENLKSLSGHSPTILHLATHGFFLPDLKKKKAVRSGISNAYSLAEDPLMRTGLILAGGNYAWSGKTPVDGVEDGVVTAYEISQLDLSATELVVLSACETALGDVKGTEGVFGLQRAFKIAGVNKMILSLWQVPDKETAELMSTFYDFWMNGASCNDAFRKAQAALRQKYPAYYWAAFVLIE